MRKAFHQTSFVAEKADLDKIIIEDIEVRERIKKEEKIYNTFIDEKNKQELIQPKF